MEIKFMGTRIGKLMWILIKIAIMGLIMTGIILINKKYMDNADGSEKRVSINITCHSGFISESHSSIT